MKIYIRLKDHGPEGQQVLFATTDRERALSMTDKDKSDEYFFGGYNQEVHEYEDEKLVMVYEWRGVAGFQIHWRYE